MNIKRTLLGLAAFATLGASPVLAQSDTHLIQRQKEASKALKHYNFELQDTGIKKNKLGRQDSSFVARGKSHTEVVQKLQDAYTMRDKLPNGYRVAGWGRQANGTYAFTMRHEDGSTVVAEVLNHPEGAEFRFWGDPTPPKRKRTTQYKFVGM